jgi:hypothetical protein
VLAQARHLLLLLRHQVLEGVVSLEVGLHLLNGGAAVRVGQRNFLKSARFKNGEYNKIL